MRGKYDHLDLGDWNAICGSCGRKGKASEMIKLPKGVPGGGMYVHNKQGCYIKRNPQDFVRGIPEKMSPPWTQPQPLDVFTDYCTTVSSVADFAIADCALPDYTAFPDEGA